MNYVDMANPDEPESNRYTRFQINGHDLAITLADARRQLDWEMHQADNAPSHERAKRRRQVKAKQRRLYARLTKLAAQ